MATKPYVVSWLPCPFQTLISQSAFHHFQGAPVLKWVFDLVLIMALIEGWLALTLITVTGGAGAEL